MTETPMRRDRGRTCPSCGSADRIPILYGYPTPEAFEQADRGEATLGGCVVGPDCPRWECRGCGTRWGQ